MLKLLRLMQDGGFHSGQALGSALGVSRSAIWKQLQLLEVELEIPLYKVRGRGYRLAFPIMLLNEKGLNAEWPIWPALVYECVDSTNAEALRQLGGGREAPFIILAEQQVAGRGRRGRQWMSPACQNLYYSVVLRIEGGARQLEGLSLVIGLAVQQALRQFGLMECGLKWPNDVLVGNKKIAGILLELSGDPADVCHVVVGIGINTNMEVMDRGINQPWTSMALELGGRVDRNQLAVRLNEQLYTYLTRFHLRGFSALQPEWEAEHLWRERSALLTAGSEKISGVILGINDRGGLRMLVGGVERVFSGGELSLRLQDDS